jgi:ABC-type branched-subunit amino acid transport system substrate-binding protein
VSGLFSFLGLQSSLFVKVNRLSSRDLIPVCLLYSSSGPYAALGQEAIDGALAAIAEVNADAGFAFRLEPVIADPRGSAEKYASLADGAIRNANCRHVIGTITSWSRKEVLPVVERHGALLWYAFPYEGYEASDQVIYLGACPNQHLLPLFEYAFPRYGGRPFVIGSNYIWGWEIGRIAREFTEAAGGEVLAERYVPLGSAEVEHLIAEIREKKPDFILSNLVGQSSNAFIKAYSALGRQDPQFSHSVRPVLSCNMTESDLAGLGEAAEGHITTSIYFDGLDTPENRDFKARMAGRHGVRTMGSPYVSAYMAVSILAQTIADAATDDPRAIREMVTSRLFSTPLGPLKIDPKTHHAALRPLLGRSNGGCEFEILESAPEAVPADPYLVCADVHFPPLKIRDEAPGSISRPPLKVVK